jgi:hypothetical protein
MARKENNGAMFFRLGAVFWLLVAAVLGVAHWFWPIFSSAKAFSFGFVLIVLAGGFLIVALLKPKA